MKNIVKFGNYKETIKRYKKAFNDGFYLECMVIDYCLLEDRLTDFFIKIRFARKNNDTIKFIKFRRRDLTNIGIEDKKCSLSKISNKIEILKTIIEFTNRNDAASSDDFQAVVNVLRRNHISDLLTPSFFGELNEWKNKRNAIIHNLMNMKNGSFWPEKEFVEKGFKLFRTIDKCVNKITNKIQPEISKIKKENLHG